MQSPLQNVQMERQFEALHAFNVTLIGRLLSDVTMTEYRMCTPFTFNDPD